MIYFSWAKQLFQLNNFARYKKCQIIFHSFLLNRNYFIKIVLVQVKWIKAGFLLLCCTSFIKFRSNKHPILIASFFAKNTWYYCISVQFLVIFHKETCHLLTRVLYRCTYFSWFGLDGDWTLTPVHISGFLSDKEKMSTYRWKICLVLDNNII